MKLRLELRVANCNIDNDAIKDHWNIKFGHADSEMAYFNAQQDLNMYN